MTNGASCVMGNGWAQWCYNVERMMENHGPIRYQRAYVGVIVHVAYGSGDHVVHNA